LPSITTAPRHPDAFFDDTLSVPKYKAEDLVRLVPGAKIIGDNQISVTKDNLPASTQMFILDPLR